MVQEPGPARSVYAQRAPPVFSEALVPSDFLYWNPGGATDPPNERRRQIFERQHCFSPKVCPDAGRRVVRSMRARAGRMAMRRSPAGLYPAYDNHGCIRQIADAQYGVGPLVDQIHWPSKQRELEVIQVHTQHFFRRSTPERRWPKCRRAGAFAPTAIVSGPAEWRLRTNAYPLRSLMRRQSVVRALGGGCQSRGAAAVALPKESRKPPIAATNPGICFRRLPQYPAEAPTAAPRRRCLI
jgi:hypothetical protein